MTYYDNNHNDRYTERSTNQDQPYLRQVSRGHPSLLDSHRIIPIILQVLISGYFLYESIRLFGLVDDIPRSSLGFSSFDRLMDSIASSFETLLVEYAALNLAICVVLVLTLVVQLVLLSYVRQNLMDRPDLYRIANWIMWGGALLGLIGLIVSIRKMTIKPYYRQPTS